MTEVFHFDAKAEVFPDYVRREYPRLAGKMSCVQTGFFVGSYRLLPGLYFGEVGHFSFLDLGVIFSRGLELGLLCCG